MYELTVENHYGDTIDSLGEVFSMTDRFYTLDIVALVRAWVIANNASELSDVIKKFDSFAAECGIPDEKKKAFFEALKSKDKPFIISY